MTPGLTPICKGVHFGSETSTGSPPSSSGSLSSLGRSPCARTLSNDNRRINSDEVCDNSDEVCDVEYQKLPEIARPLSKAGEKGTKSKVDAEDMKEKREDNMKSALVLLVLLVSGVIMFSLYCYVVRLDVSATDRWMSGPLRRSSRQIPELPDEFSVEPLAKSVVRQFDAYSMAHGGKDDSANFRANANKYVTRDMTYEAVGFGTSHTPGGWSALERTDYRAAFPQTMFTQMLFLGDRRVATSATYGNALWAGDLLGVEAPHQWVTLRMTDFYAVHAEAKGHGRISYNFMMIDWVDAFRQIGRQMLPPASLKEGIVLPPAANDGVPAPLSVLVQSQGRDSEAARAVAEAALQQDWAAADGSAGKNSDAALRHWHDDLTYYGPGGIGLARSPSEYAQHVVGPFRSAFTNRTAVVELSACEGNYCGLFGHLTGHGIGKWLGLPTVGRDVSFRFAMHYRVVGDKVQEGWTVFDFPGLFAELGLDFFALASAGGRLQGLQGNSAQ